jgi:LysM repeat protein
MVDAGHGGSDPGTISPYLPLEEKDVTLRLAKLTGNALARRGVSVVYTRTSDRFVPLETRAAAARQTGANALVSLHLNSAPNPLVGGAEAWYGAAPGGADLAGALLGSAARPLRTYGVGVRGTRLGDELAVLKTAVPAALIEVGYVSNAREAAVLGQDAFLAAVADGIAAGVVAFRDASAASAASAPSQRQNTPLRSMFGALGMYFVQPGDTLGAIATRLGLPVDELSRLNPTSLAQSLLPGQALQLPAGSGGAAAPARGSTAATNATLPAVRRIALSGTYVVNPGETLSDIALRSGRTVDELARLNNVADPDLIRAGQELLLSQPAATTTTVGAARSSSAPAGKAAGGAGRRYTVRSGDTLSEIALRLGVRAEDLIAANDLKDPDHVLAGSVIVVPAA